MSDFWEGGAVDAGGSLTEAEFLAAMGRILRQAQPRKVFITSRATIAAALAAADRLEGEALVLEAELARLRWWQWRRRPRVRRRLGQALAQADALRRTFASSDGAG